MDETLTPEEVAIIIRARRILKEKGLAADTDVTGVCKAAGVSRKTGYQWAEKHLANPKDRQKQLEAELAKLQADCDRLRKENDWLGFENRGRKLAWEIHGVDELIAEKKSTIRSKKKKER
jgi:peptidoglycan hydrolase CwlO-like protein